MKHDAPSTPHGEASKRAAVYRKAALNMESAKPNKYGFVTPCACCEAIYKALPPILEGADLESPFAALFRPEDAPSYWWGDCICEMPETKDERVLALCFMAAITERP